MSGLYKVCMACKNSDSIPKNGTCGFPLCGGENCFKDFTPRENRTGRTLLDEFAIAAMAAIISKAPHDSTPLCEVEGKIIRICGGAYSYAAAMMRERARRDEMGNVKEATE